MLLLAKSCLSLSMAAMNDCSFFIVVVVIYLPRRRCGITISSDARNSNRFTKFTRVYLYLGSLLKTNLFEVHLARCVTSLSLSLAIPFALLKERKSKKVKRNEVL